MYTRKMLDSSERGEACGVLAQFADRDFSAPLAFARGYRGSSSVPRQSHAFGRRGPCDRHATVVSQHEPPEAKRCGDRRAEACSNVEKYNPASEGCGEAGRSFRIRAFRLTGKGIKRRALGRSRDPNTSVPR
jgi:hypothetical protein